MGNQISPVAWLLLAVLIFVIVLVNLALIAMFIGRNRPGKGKSPGPPSQRMPYNDLPDTIRHPWHKEDQMLEELAQRVKDIHKPESK